MKRDVWLFNGKGIPYDLFDNEDIKYTVLIEIMANEFFG